MSRAICCHCHRPQKVCICDFIQPIDNQVEIGILQHPTETKQIKGTAIIAKNSLQCCQYWVGESLQELPGLVNWLNDGKQVYLLYPKTEDADSMVKVQGVDFLKSQDKAAFRILILDGTWRKTFKMMQLNPSLQKLDRVALIPSELSKYKIRKQKNEQSLSTVEAVYELLSQLEDSESEDKFKPLLTAFENMQQQQLAFRQ